MIAFARAIRPYTRKIDWVFLCLAIWAVIIEGVRWCL